MRKIIDIPARELRIGGAEVRTNIFRFDVTISEGAIRAAVMRFEARLLFRFRF